MSIAYETIDNTVRVPLAYIEFDNSGAVKGRLCCNTVR